MAATTGAECFRRDNWEKDYWERLITAPTTRRVELCLWSPKDPPFHGRRLALLDEACGDNFVDVMPGTLEDLLRLNADLISGMIPSPSRRVAEELGTWPSPSRRIRGGFGTWAYYCDTLASLEGVVAALGWTLTEDERRLVDALEQYGQRAPSWALRAAQAA